MRARRERGFTLVELMIVVAIISIFATMAMPNFQDRIIQTQLEESFRLTQPFKESIEAFYAQHGRFPKENSEAGIPPAEKLIGNYVSSVTLENGAFQITLGNRINAHVKDKTITIRPAMVPESPQSPVAWLCGNAEPVSGMIAGGENKTDIIRQYLPFACRSWK